MVGAILCNMLRQSIAESTGTWVDFKTSFDYLFEAAKDFAKETRACSDSQSITTVASISEYELKPNFTEVITTDDHNHPTICLTDSNGNESWIDWESYSDYLQNDNTASTPNSFCIIDQTIKNRITGTTTATGTYTGGESILTDSSADFSTVTIGDYVINTSQNAYGYVLGIGTTLTTAMFILATSGGVYASWASGDTYIIQPAPRYKIILDPAPSIGGDIINVAYIAKPYPVYSDYGMYTFATGYEEALISYATWKYRYRDSKPQLADPLYVTYERQMRKAKNTGRKAVGAKGFSVNFTK